jgi:hypothetical protein
MSCREPAPRTARPLWLNAGSGALWSCATGPQQVAPSSSRVCQGMRQLRKPRPPAVPHAGYDRRLIGDDPEETSCKGPLRLDGPSRRSSTTGSPAPASTSTPPSRPIPWVRVTVRNDNSDTWRAGPLGTAVPVTSRRPPATSNHQPADPVILIWLQGEFLVGYEACGRVFMRCSDVTIAS